MIDSTSINQVSFSGKTFKKPRFDAEDFEDVYTKVEKGFKKTPSSENYRAYAKIQQTNEIRLKYNGFGYALNGKSVELPVYKGPKNQASGLSTEANGMGGGWLKASLDTPLSTTDVHTCAVLNLVDEANNEQVLFHVYHGSSADDIAEFISNKFPKFNKVNIIAGNIAETQNTVNKIVSGVNRISPNVEKQFYHMGTENPEIVAYKGGLSYVKGQSSNKVSFKEIKQYYFSQYD